jgi:hypothetical protein
MPLGDVALLLFDFFDRLMANNEAKTKRIVLCVIKHVIKLFSLNESYSESSFWKRNYRESPQTN